MASQDAFQGQPASFEGAIFPDGFLGVLRTGGGVAACRRRKRGDAGAIECYQRKEERGEQLGNQGADELEKMFHKKCFISFPSL